MIASSFWLPVVPPFALALMIPMKNRDGAAASVGFIAQRLVNMVPKHATFLHNKKITFFFCQAFVPMGRNVIIIALILSGSY